MMLNVSVMRREGEQKLSFTGLQHANRRQTWLHALARKNSARNRKNSWSDPIESWSMNSFLHCNWLHLRRLNTKHRSAHCSWPKHFSRGDFCLRQRLKFHWTQIARRLAAGEGWRTVRKAVIRLENSHASTIFTRPWPRSVANRFRLLLPHDRTQKCLAFN